MTLRRKIAVAIAAAILVCAVGILGFIQGMFYANRKATITIANDGSFHTVEALRAMKEPKRVRIAMLFDADMDLYASKLAEMCLKYPREIQRKHYNVLVRVRDYRNQFGRDPQRTNDPSFAVTDKKIAEAIAYLESIHNMKEWGRYKFDFENEPVKAE